MLVLRRWDYCKQCCNLRRVDWLVSEPCHPVSLPSHLGAVSVGIGVGVGVVADLRAAGRAVMSTSPPTSDGMRP